MQRNEVKGNLAKLLATENLVVEHRQCETAQFDVDRRVLTLPTWDLASNDVYDMLVGHEEDMLCLLQIEIGEQM